MKKQNVQQQSTQQQSMQKVWETKGRGTDYSQVLEIANELGLKDQDKGVSWKIRKYQHGTSNEYFKLKVLKA